LHAVADFTPGAAVGRIRVGQPARLRLEGYPWMQYGSVPARVDRVGTEAREGVVRVELTILARGDSSIPMQHGLTGQMEVAVEEVTPYELTLRATGRALTTGKP
jgi:membrane fusion protein (multidrug efflux system)